MNKYLMLTAGAIVFFAAAFCPSAQAATSTAETGPTVRVEVRSPANKVLTWGSGVVVDAMGRVVTNNHVITQKTNHPENLLVLCVTTNEAKPPSCSLRARIIKTWPSMDLALLQITEVSDKSKWISLDEYRLRYKRNPSFLKYVSFNRKDTAKKVIGLGDELRVLGYPTGTSTIAYARGTVKNFAALSAFSKNEPASYKINSDVRVSPGTSGGAVFTSTSTFVGLAVKSTRGTGNVDYIISIPTLNHFMVMALGNSYKTALPSALPPDMLKGVYTGFLKTEPCPMFSTRETTGGHCRCHDGFFAVGDSCIVGATFCSILGGSYAMGTHVCLEIPVEVPKPVSTVTCIGGAVPRGKACKCPTGSTWDNIKFICAKPAVKTPTAITPKVQPVTPAKVKYFVGVPKNKTDLLNCLVVANKYSKLYYLRGARYLKYASYSGKICFADEAAAKKAKYYKAR